MVWRKEIFGPPSQGDNTIFTFWFVVAIILGAIIGVVYARKAMSGWLTLRGATKSDDVPAEWVDRCFKGEVERILAVLIRIDNKEEPTSASELCRPIEDFPLPAFKRIEELSAEAYSKVVALGTEFNKTEKWNLLGIYDEEGIKNHQEHWQELLNK
jgi:hypothetical protein